MKHVAIIEEKGNKLPRFRVQGYLEREELEDAIEALLAVLDATEGDLDLEPNGDELDCLGAEDDFCDQNQNWRGEPGCPLSDPGGCEHDGCEPDCDVEREQLLDDVPTLPVFAAEYDEADRRVFLGYSNLTTSFAGTGVRSADTGRILPPRAERPALGLPA
jgi:hypothetical protein